MDARAGGARPFAGGAGGVERFCAAYYAPVFAFIRHNTPDPDAARDLTQEFFARLLSRQSLGAPEPERGRFRSYLLGAVKHFLADQYDRSRAAKRGSGRESIPLDTGSAGDTTVALQIPIRRHCAGRVF